MNSQIKINAPRIGEEIKTIFQRKFNKTDSQIKQMGKEQAI